MRNEVRGGSEETSSGTNKKAKRSRDASEDQEDEEDRLSFRDALAAVLSPFLLPQIVLGDDFQTDGFFQAFPYADGRSGYMRLDRFFEEAPPPKYPPLDVALVKSWMGRLTLQESNDFRGLNRVNGQILLDTASRFGLQTSWTYLHERLPRGRSDELVLGDLDLMFRFAQNEWVQMRAGLGARFLIDRSRTDAGFNFTYGADIYPVKPLIFSLTADVGNLGSAGVFHGRVTVGAIFARWEVFAGYDYLRIGGVELQGPTIGIRLWF